MTFNCVELGDLRKLSSTQDLMISEGKVVKIK